MRWGRLAVATLICCCSWPTADAEPAIGQFELKTLDSEPGALEFQSQNAWSWGQPGRQVASADPNTFVFDDNAVIRQRHALELEAGLTRSLKMRAGVEFEKERLDDPETLDQANTFDDLQLTEIGVELIAILVPRLEDGAGLGVVIEYERPVDRDEPDALVVGSVVEFVSNRWFIAAVPMAVRSFGGDDESGEKWDFAYAAQVAYSWSERSLFALEGYGTIERLRSSGPRSESAQLFGDFDQHRAGPVLYHAFGADDASLTIGVGLLAGLNHHTPDQTLKLSIELDF